MLRALCFAAMLGLLVSPATAEIMVTMDPAASAVNIADGTAAVEIWADIPVEDAIVGFGFDADLTGTSAAFGGFAYNAALFMEMPDGDGDGIQGLVPLPGVVSGNVLLGEMTFSLVELGLTDVAFSATPGDLNEGFALETPGEFAAVTYCGGCINVVPEPTALALLALGALALRRR